MKINKFVILLFAFFLPLNITNSQQWISSGLNGKKVVSFASIGNFLISGTRSLGIYRSTDNGQTWMKVSNGDLDLAYIDAMTVVNDIVIVGTNIGGRAIYISSDSGLTWNPVYSSVEALVPALISRNDTIFAGTLYGGAFRSTNAGASWTHLGSEVFYPAFILSMLWSDDNLYAGTHSNYSGMWKSTDFGSTWYTVNSGLPKDPTSGIIRDVSSIAAKGNTIFAGTSWAGCYRSTNNGTYWDSINSGLPPLTYVYTLTTNDSDIYLGTFGGVYQSIDNGDSWASMSDGLPANITVFKLFIHDSELHAGTDSGIWKIALNTLEVSERVKTTVPSGYQLKQNYPNPFNPSTAIQFSMTHTGYVTLRVYNLLGEEIASLFSKILPAGTYETNWDASNFSSGIYFYRLQVNGFIETKKLLLVK